MIYGLSSALICVVCFVTCKLHAIFLGNSLTKSRIFFWNVKHIWSHYNFKKSKQMCRTTDAEPAAHPRTRLRAAPPTRLFAAPRPEHSERTGLSGFHWSLNMLTSTSLTLQAVSLLFLQPWQLSSSLTDHTSVFSTASVLLFILAAAKRSSESLLRQMYFVSTDATAWGCHLPSWVPTTYVSPPPVTHEPTCASQGRGDSSVHPPPSSSPQTYPIPSRHWELSHWEPP